MTTWKRLALNVPVRRRNSGGLLVAVALLLAAPWSRGSDKPLDAQGENLRSSSAWLGPVAVGTKAEISTHPPESLHHLESVGSSQHRRSLFGGLVAGLVILPAGSSSVQAAEQSAECEACCSKDWCGCSANLCDCAAYFKSKGFVVPLAASEAIAAGGKRWAESLEWRSATLPGWAPVAESDLEVKASALEEDAGQGLFARSALSKGSILPPFMGVHLSRLELELKKESDTGLDYTWCPAGVIKGLKAVRDEDPTYCVDAEPAAIKNPARYVNAAASDSQCAQLNVEACELGEVMYLRTTTTVPARAELVTTYDGLFYNCADLVNLEA